MMKSSLAIMFQLFSVVLMANMGQMKLAEASVNRMLSQAADQNGIVLPCPPGCPHNHTHPNCCDCDTTKGSCNECCKTSTPLIVRRNKRPLFPDADQNGIVLPCPPGCPHNLTHPNCCDCDFTKGSCKRCC
ncbi:uncharacterized protein LOC133709284 [Rosa rugosa]|uniref:uncharacterized protein LOC133709284 n=1 Tax=Rosa rugosa TaxID=74645 RepID=UPI002B40EA4E|nr:uncharacterized protein LOC133709284 [Rosa rugosa]